MGESLIQRSLAGGEIAPALYGRADQIKYQTGLKTCRNFIVQKHGGAANRPGTAFTVEVKNSAVMTYFIKFIFNDDQTYVIEIGNLYMRFIRNGAQIVVSGVAAYNGATPYAIGDLVSQAGINYYCIAATTGNAPPNATYWYPLTGDIYEIPTPYVTADLPTLQFVQSGDVVTITHASYDPKELTRTGHTAWTLATKAFAPTISAPTSVVNTGAAGGNTSWVVTALLPDSYEESVASTLTSTVDVPSSGAPLTVSWAAVSGAIEYNVYKAKNGVFGYIGTAVGLSFTDNGIDPNLSVTPPITRNPFSGAGNRPAVVSYYQQRQMFANQNNNTEKVFGSRSGLFSNFTISSPLQDDDSVTFTVAGRKVNAVRHMIDIGVLVLLTQSGEFLVEGDQDGVLRANQPPNLRQIGYNGASPVMPVIINDSLLYLQARGSIVRDLRYAVSSGGDQASYKGRDLTVYAGHLFANKTLTRMDYAQIPNSILWIVRSDGVLLGLTYLTDHEVWGWHRHDTDGFIEDVCVVPEGSIDATYLMVRRTINGVTKRYIERMADREFTDIEVDALFLDSHLTYDGRNTGATTVTLSTGGGWTVNDEITVTAALGTPFVVGDPGNDIVVWVDVDSVDEAGDTVTTRTKVKIRVDTYTSSTVVSGYPDKDVPASLRSTALTTWGRAVDQVSGLGHLEAKDIAALGDGNVIANPNNDQYETVTVTAGVATFDRPYLIIHAGLPYFCDIQTLDLDVNGQQIRDRQKNVNHMALLVESTRGLFIGPTFSDLDEKQPDPIDDYDTPWPLKTGLIEMPIASTWQESGSFCIRQKDPLPATILSIIPSGDIGG